MRCLRSVGLVLLFAAAGRGEDAKFDPKPVPVDAERAKGEQALIPKLRERPRPAIRQRDAALTWLPVVGERLAFSPSGTRLAVTGEGRLRVFDLATGRPTLDVPGGGGDFRQFARGEVLAWSPDGKRLAVQRAAKGVTVLDAADGSVVKELEVADAVHHLGFSADGDRLVAVVNDPKANAVGVRQWAVKDWSAADLPLKNNANWFWAAAPGGDYFVSGPRSFDTTRPAPDLEVWHLASGRRSVVTCPYPLQEAALHADNRTLLGHTGGGGDKSQLVAVDLVAGKGRAICPAGPVMSAPRLTPDGKYVLLDRSMPGSGYPFAFLIDAASGKTVWSQRGVISARHIAVSPGGTLLAAPPNHLSEHFHTHLFAAADLVSTAWADPDAVQKARDAGADVEAYAGRIEISRMSTDSFNKDTFATAAKLFPKATVATVRNNSGPTRSEHYRANIEALKALPGLTEVHLERCDLGDDDIAGLADLKAVKKLMLISGGRVTAKGLAHLKGMADLEALHIEFAGGVGDDAMDLIAGLPKLRAFTVRRSEVTNAGVAKLAKSKTVESLSITGREKLDGAAFKDLADMPRLRELHLDEFWATDDELAELARCSGLEVLTWNQSGFGEKFTAAGLARLAGLKKLRHFAYEGNKKSPAKGLADWDLGRFEVLDLGGMKFSNDDLKMLGAATACKRLTVPYYDVTADGLKHLTGLKGLDQLTLPSKTEIPADKVEELRKALPGVLVR